MPANNFPNFPNFPNFIREEMEQLEKQLRKESERLAELVKQKQDEDSKSNS